MIGWDSFWVRRGIDSGAQIGRSLVERGGSTVSRSSAAMEAMASFAHTEKMGVELAFWACRAIYRSRGKG